jgi:mannose-1-phosphate guanylyltransferase
MRALVLAAGFGTRLRPLTDHLPKALVPVCGIPLLERNLGFLYGNDIRELAVNAHYLPEQLGAFQKRIDIPFTLFHERGAIRGTGGALHFARDFLSRGDTFLVANVDIISNIDLRKIVREFEQSSRMCTLVATPSQKNGTIYYNKETKEYYGTPADYSPDQSTATADFIGIALYRREMLSCITEDDFSILPVWRRAKEKGFSVAVSCEPGVTWYDTGTPEALARIHFDVLDTTFALTLPDNMHIDAVRKIAYPEDLIPARQVSLKEYAWTDTIDIHESSSVSHSIVFAQGVVPEHAAICNQIVSPWGVIPFYE